MDFRMKRYLRIVIILLVAMAIIFAVQLISNRSLHDDLPLTHILGITLISGLCFLPLALFSLLIDRSIDQDQVMAVKELELSERDLKEAAAQWVYTQHGVAPEGDLVLHIDEDGEISCLVHIPG